MNISGLNFWKIITYFSNLQVGDINVQTLISYTSFNDESGENPDRLVAIKRWLWSIVEKMSPLEKQDLVFFWTGSPALPASEDGFQPMPSVTIRPADDTHLPSANTCISRLYVPLYSSKAVLKSKLLMAIKTKNFGFVWKKKERKNDETKNVTEIKV